MHRTTATSLSFPPLAVFKKHHPKLLFFGISAYTHAIVLFFLSSTEGRGEKAGRHRHRQGTGQGRAGQGVFFSHYLNTFIFSITAFTVTSSSIIMITTII